VIYGSPTDRPSFPYLANFIAAGSRVGTIELSFPVFCDIHLAPKTSVIYNSTPHSSNSQASLYPGSQKVSKHLSLPSIPATFAPFPMQINYALISDNSPHRFESIGINKRKPRGHLPLKRIKPRFTPDYIIRYLLHMLRFILLYGKIPFHTNCFVPAIYFWVDSFSITVK
jgi:hypothetical protein